MHTLRKYMYIVIYIKNPYDEIENKGGKTKNSVVHYVNDVIILPKRCDRFLKPSHRFI